MFNIYLIGFMAAGKSAVGRIVAHRLGRPFVDLDEVLTGRFGVSIENVFASPGEAAFRQAEREELERLSRLHGHVVAVGGGAFCDSVNRDLMHAGDGQTVFLDVPWPVLAARLAADPGGRPLYRTEREAGGLYRSRRSHYVAARRTLVLNGSESPEEVAGRVVEAVSGASCVT